MNTIQINSNLFINNNIECVLNYYKQGKATIHKTILNKKILVNNQPVQLSYVIKENDEITFLDEEIKIIPYKRNIEILFENDYIIVVNKPANILVHPDGNTNETLQNAVAYYLIKNKKPVFCQAVHRLDYETTGIIIFAKNNLALSFLSYAFENKMIKKEYACLINGKMNPLNGIIDKPIGKDRHSNKQVVCKTGKPAKTIYETIWFKAGISKLKIQIIGGRKHQIRIHFQSAGHPIIGDKIYANDNDEQLKLHACKLMFLDPQTYKEITIESKENF